MKLSQERYSQGRGPTGARTFQSASFNGARTFLSVKKNGDFTVPDKAGWKTRSPFRDPDNTLKGIQKGIEL